MRAGHGINCVRGDRGVAVVFFAISVTAMLAVGALVLGGGIGYSTSRNAQTAADSAALAGATALNEHKQNWTTMLPGDLVKEIESVVKANGGELEACDLIQGSYGVDNAESAVIPGGCAGLPFLSEPVFQSVAGVRVKVRETRDVPFGAFVNEEEITTTAVAAATIQPFVSAESWSVFMLCTSPDAVGHPAQALVEDPNDPTGYSIRESARGKVYVLWGNEIKEHGSGRDCGNPSSDWRGLIQFDQTFPIPSPSTTDDSEWWAVEEGNTTGNIDVAPNVLGPDACELDGEDITALDMDPPCKLAIPLCPFSNKGLPGGSADFRLYCPKMGVFTISHIEGLATTLDAEQEQDLIDYDSPCGKRTNNIICGILEESAVAREGQGSSAAPGKYDYVVIKLVE